MTPTVWQVNVWNTLGFGVRATLVRSTTRAAAIRLVRSEMNPNEYRITAQKTALTCYAREAH